jgi:hypothetical protein
MTMYLADVAHQSLRGGVNGVEDHELRNSRTSFTCQLIVLCNQLAIVPAPRTLAVLDSLLNSFADDWVPAAACATFATASFGDGVIVRGKCARYRNYKLYESRPEKVQHRVLGVSTRETRAGGDKMSTPKSKNVPGAGAARASEDARHGTRLRATDVAQTFHSTLT